MPNQFGPTFVQQTAYPGPSLSYTPTLTQAGVAVTKTVTYANYMQIGKLMIVWVKLAVTGAGTGNNFVTVGLPAAASVFAPTLSRIGFGTIVASGVNYGVLWFADTATTIQAVRTDTNFTDIFGKDPNVALANNDGMQATVIYELA